MYYSMWHSAGPVFLTSPSMCSPARAVLIYLGGRTERCACIAIRKLSTCIIFCFESFKICIICMLACINWCSCWESIPTGVR